MDIAKQAVPNSMAVTGLDAAHANEYFELFVNATSMKHILGYYRGIIDSLHLRPNVFNSFYPKLKANLTSWRAKALLKKIDARAAHKCYMKGKLAANTRVLVIGGGPCGLRTAIEAQLLGAKVVVIEKRDRFSRNNVLHLWPFVIEDLRMLGAKKFFGKFCAGAIDHISIRQLQCILLKVALLLGIEIHTEVSFENLVEPDADKKIGWRAECKPSGHPVSQYEFDVIIGADGKRNTLEGFSRKEFRGKLAIAITANFINKKTEAEARVEEISGVAFIFNQKFFKDLQEGTRIDLENIVYYKDDTHYFVMTAKKHSLIEKGVIKQDFPDTERLLAPENVNKEALQNYAIEAANFSTNYIMPNLEFAVNHYGQPDVAMFDFTSMYAAENASKIVDRNGYRLLKILVGDSLLEPFWPTGSGCARGFLSALDAAWAIRSWSMGTVAPLDTIAERESIYRLLAQTTPDNLNKDWKSYTLDPATRYPNLNKAFVLPHQVIALYDTDNPASVERMKRSYNEKPNEIPKKKRRGNVDNEVLLNWLKDQLKDKEDINITDMASVFKDGKVLCAIIHHYRPDLLDYSAIKHDDPIRNNQIAIDILEMDLCILPVMTGSEITVTEDYLTMATYLTEIYDCFRGEIPFIKHPKLKWNTKTPRNKIKHPPALLSQNLKIPYQNLKIPCQKCYNAYSNLCLYSDGIEKNIVTYNRTCESIIIPQTKRDEKNVEIMYKKSTRKLKRKGKKNKNAESSSRKYLSIENNCNKTSSRNSAKFSTESFYLKKFDFNLDSNQEDIQRKCIERICSKHEKLKIFLTKLLLKRKKSEVLTNNVSSVKTQIFSVQTDIKSNIVQTYTVKNGSVQTDVLKNDSVHSVTVKNESVITNAAKNNRVLTDAVKNNRVLTDAVKNTIIKTDSLKNDSVHIDTVKNESVRTNAAKNNRVLTNAVKNTRVQTYTVKNNSVQTDVLKNDSVHIDTVKNESVRTNATKNNRVLTDAVKNNRVLTDAVKNNRFQIDSLKNDSVHIDTVKNESVRTNATKINRVLTDAVKNNRVLTDAVKNTIINTDSLKNDSVHIDTVKNESVRTNATKINRVLTDAVKNNRVLTDAVKNTIINTDSLKNDSVHIDTVKNESVRTNAAKNNRVLTYAVKNNRVLTDAVKNNRFQIDSLKNDSVHSDTVKNESVRTNAAKNNRVLTDAVKNNRVLTDAVKNTIIKTDSLKNDSVHIDTVKNESVRTNAAKNNRVQTYTVNNIRVLTDAVKNNRVLTDAVKNNRFQTDSLKNDSVHSDTVKNESVRTNAAKNNRVLTDAVKNNRVLTDAVKNNRVLTDTVKNTIIKTDSLKNDSVHIDTVKNESVRTNSAKNNRVLTDAVKNNSVQTDAVKNNSVQTNTNSIQNIKDNYSSMNLNLVNENNIEDSTKNLNSEKSHIENNIERIFSRNFYENKFHSQRKYPSSRSMEKIIKIRIMNRNSKKSTIQIRQKSLYSSASPPCIRTDSNWRRKQVCHDSNDVTSNCSCQFKFVNRKKIVSHDAHKMLQGDGMPNQIFSRVSNWISSNDFLCHDTGKTDTDAGSMVSNSKLTDMTSVSKMDQYDDIVVEERTDVINFSDKKTGKSSEENFAEKLKNVQSKSVRTLSKYSQYSPFQYCANLRSASAPPTQFSVIVEGEEPELPPGSTKMTEVSYKTIKTTNMHLQKQQQAIAQPSTPSNRHRHKHSEAISQKPASIDRKSRKRRTMDKVGASVEERQRILEEIVNNRVERHNKRRYQRKLQTEQFLKSMQMLQANAKPDSQPFEDYSIFLYRQTAAKFEDRVKDLEKQFTYIPDHENKPNQMSRGGGKDEDIAAKIKHLENKWRQPQHVDRKPKDLLRAIGKIETSDWNIKEIEKKILENKLGKPSKAFDKEKVPKWSKEQFLARQTKMEKQHLDRQNSGEAKFADIDRNIKNLDQKLKEGNARELGTKKVASITEKLVSKIPVEPKPPEKTVARHHKVLPKQAASEFCHFCNKRVYLMERLSAEGRFFHHGCFKCQYCHVQLRLSSYAFDRDGLYGYKFFCLQHFGMAGEAPTVKVTRKPSVRRQGENRKSPEKGGGLADITRVDSLEKVQTPERIEFSNLSTGHVSSDQDDSLNQMDEDEWTDKNFGGSCAEFDDTDDDSSSLSDSDSDDEDAYGDALEEPATKEGTLKLAERWKNSYSQRRNSDSNEYISSSSDQSSYYDSSDDDESDTATEGEDEIRARELRKQEVCVEPPIVHTDTGTDTEVVSDETSSESSNEVHNSATEISTDSEFAQDDPTPTRELPSLFLNDFNVTKTRGSGGNGPKKIQVTSRYLQKASDGKHKKPNIELKLTPLVPSSAHAVKKPAPIQLARPEGYVLNRTQSTGGIAAKVSLELKKKYLLGEPSTGGIQKSGSASTLDTKFKSFHTNISDCQKLLKRSTETSASMQTFCKKLEEMNSPVSPVITKDIEEVAEVNAVEENDSEGRPRSPLHETFIVVPQIDWSKQNNSLTSDSLASSDSEKDLKFENIPTIEIYSAQDIEQPKEEFVADSLPYFQEDQSKMPSVESPKSIAGEKKTLNQPKTLPNLENLLPEIHNSLHIKYKDSDVARDPVKNSSSPESMADEVTTALTETELSDWARDEVVSDDFEDGEFEISFIPETRKLTREDKIILTEGTNNIMGVDLDGIEFMDTGTETSSDDGIANSQNGYVLFKNDDEFATDSLNPHINDVIETINVHVDEKIDKPDDATNMDAGTTTEENTFTDSTVKNVNENNNVNEHKNKNTDADLTVVVGDVKVERDNNIEFDEHCQRLKSKVEFSNAKDSIDIRKGRRKSKPDVLQKPDLIREEIPSPMGSPKSIPPAKFHSPLYNKEVIKKERDTNQKLIQEMVMNKMKAENKSLERRRRNKTITNQKPNFDVVGASNNSNQGATSRRSIFSANVDFINSESAYSMQEAINKNKTPEEMNRKLEKLKQTIKLKKKDNEQLLIKKRERERGSLRRCISGNYDSVPAERESLSLKAKSVSELVGKLTPAKASRAKSDPNILETIDDKNNRKKSQDKKGLSKFFIGIFTRKSPSSKGLFSKLSPKSKEVSKSCTNLEYGKDPVIYSHRKSLSENFIDRNVTPPPVPPLPANYVRKTDDSSEADEEEEMKKLNDSSCDTLDCTGVSISSTAGRRSGKSLRTIRQAQLKRHRMAQEIQRKLEETEVKMRELEDRGVRVEKALRGEGSSDSSKDEPELLQEWFDLMRDRTELRRYERELTVRAQELELEDRHARLQHELRDRIENDKPKTLEDVEVEESIINEMIMIVEKRDSLITEIEEDKIRYSHEDRDLEEQMLAKGLILTPVKKSPK